MHVGSAVVPRGRPFGASPVERMVWVLFGVADRRVSRDPLYGDLAPWALDDRSVGWEITLLTIMGVVSLDPLGSTAPTLTRFGSRMMTFWARPGGASDTEATVEHVDR